MIENQQNFTLYLPNMKPLILFRFIFIAYIFFIEGLQKFQNLTKHNFQRKLSIRFTNNQFQNIFWQIILIFITSFQNVDLIIKTFKAPNYPKILPTLQIHSSFNDLVNSVISKVQTFLRKQLPHTNSLLREGKNIIEKNFFNSHCPPECESLKIQNMKILCSIKEKLKFLNLNIFPIESSMLSNNNDGSSVGSFPSIVQDSEGQYQADNVVPERFLKIVESSEYNAQKFVNIRRKKQFLIKFQQLSEVEKYLKKIQKTLTEKKKKDLFDFSSSLTLFLFYDQQSYWLLANSMENKLFNYHLVGLDQEKDTDNKIFKYCLTNQKLGSMIHLLTKSKRMDCESKSVRDQLREELFKILKKHDWNGKFLDLLEKIGISYHGQSKQVRQKVVQKYYDAPRQSQTLLPTFVSSKAFSELFVETKEVKNEEIVLFFMKKKGKRRYNRRQERSRSCCLTYRHQRQYQRQKDEKNITILNEIEYFNPHI